MLSSAINESLDTEILEEVELMLGAGRRAVRITFASEKWMRRALRLAIPGCMIDYLPPAPEQQIHVAISVASTRDCLPVLESVKNALEIVGHSQIKSLAVDSRNCSFIAEVYSVDDWYRALALNGASIDGVIVKVSRFFCDGPSPMTSEIKSPLSLFLKVPEDVPNLDEAVKGGASKIVLASGMYHLPNGLSLQRAVEIVGDGHVELVLGAPVVIRSDQGALLRNLTFRASSIQTPAVPALLRIHGSYTVVVGKSYNPTSKTSSCFAACSWGRPAVILERCKFIGGHHGIDIRGWSGLRVRGGRDRRNESDFDFGSWISRCHARQHSHPSGDGLQFQVQQGSTTITYPKWFAIHETCVEVTDCDICETEAEAVYVWRGAQLKMVRSRIHHCGMGIGVSHVFCDNAFSKMAMQEDYDDHSPIGLLSKLVVLDIRSCWFEDISAFAYSAALSIGSFAPQANNTIGSKKDCMDNETLPMDAMQFKRIEATLFRNQIVRCSLGIVCSGAHIQATENKLENIILGAWRLCDTVADLCENRVANCGGVALAVHSSCNRHFDTFQGRVQNCKFSECGLGVRLTSEGRVCNLAIGDSTFECCGDGIGILSAGCMADLQRCKVHKSIRCAVRVGRGARVKLDDCRVTSNGRGIIVAARSKADVSKCHFDDNVGWAVRLDDDNIAERVQDVARGDASSEMNGLGHSVISNNVFGSATRGKVGQKRIRIDTWHEGRFHVEGNHEIDDGVEVQAFRKRVRLLEEEQANMLASTLSSLSMAD